MDTVKYEFVLQSIHLWPAGVVISWYCVSLASLFFFDNAAYVGRPIYLQSDKNQLSSRYHRSGVQ